MPSYQGVVPEPLAGAHLEGCLEQESGRAETDHRAKVTPPISPAGILVAHYLQSITPCLALGGELVYHRRPGEEGTVMSLAGKYTCEPGGRGWGRGPGPCLPHAPRPLGNLRPPPLSYSEQLVGDGNVGPGGHACHLLPQSQRPGEPSQGPTARACFAGEGGQAPACQGVGPGKLTLARRLGPSSCRWAWSSRPARGCRTPASPSGTSWTCPRPTSSSKVQASVSLLGNRWA